MSEQVWQVTAKDGLPPTDKWVLAAPVGPGRACVVGTFGHTWCAIASFDTRRCASVEVIHEARKAVNAEEDRDAQARDPHVAFHPAYVFAVRDRSGDGAEQQRVVIGRLNTLDETHLHPLHVDPSDGSVRFTGSIGPSDAAPYYFTTHEGAMYWLTPDGPGTMSLHRYGFPDLATETLAKKLPQGRVAMGEGRVHIVGQQWWTADRPAGPFRLLRGEVPQSSLTQVFDSHHYGMLLLTNTNNDDTGGTPFEVEFTWGGRPGGD